MFVHMYMYIRMEDIFRYVWLPPATSKTPKSGVQQRNSLALLSHRASDKSSRAKHHGVVFF